MKTIKKNSLLLTLLSAGLIYASDNEEDVISSAINKPTSASSVRAPRAGVPQQNIQNEKEKADKWIFTEDVMDDATFTEVFPTKKECDDAARATMAPTVCEETAGSTDVDTDWVD